MWAQPIEKLAPLIRSGKVSPVAVAQSCLERIAAHDGKLMSFIHVAQDALEQARQAEVQIKSGNWLGPLHGIPIRDFFEILCIWFLRLGDELGIT